LWRNPAFSAEPAASDSAVYTVTFESTWSAATHPADFPGNAHFSGLIGGTHNDRVVFWSEGQPASAGMESMAETGAKGTLSNEVDAAIDAGDAAAILSGGGIGTSPGTVSMTFTIDRDYPRVTLVSMVAPSPDWFVGVAGLELYRDGAWVDRLEVPLFPYDAGTDSGATYTAANQDTVPTEPIFRIATYAFLDGHRVPTIGSFTFVRQN
jgi:hypothetical protein